MKKPFLLFLFNVIFFVIFSQLTISSTNHKNDSNQVDDQQNLHQQLGVFAFERPDGLNFAGENVPLYSSEIWERFDNELLEMFIFNPTPYYILKKANKFFPVIEPILEKYGVPDDFKYLAIIESGLENVISPSGAGFGK